MARRFLSTGAKAEGFIAIGNVARGTIAIGNVAVGVIAIGNVAVGVVSIGLAASVGVITASVNAVGLVAIGVNSVGVVSIAAVNGLGGIGVSGVNGGFSPWMGAAASALAFAAWQVVVVFPWLRDRFGAGSVRSLLDGTATQLTLSVRVVERGANDVLTFVDRSGASVRATLTTDALAQLPTAGLGSGFVVASFLAARPGAEPSGGHGDLQMGRAIRCTAVASRGMGTFPPRTAAGVYRVLIVVWPLAALFGLALSVAIPLALPYAPEVFARLGIPLPVQLGGEPSGKLVPDSE